MNISFARYTPSAESQYAARWQDSAIWGKSKESRARERVQARYGNEFPIRFDFLDTMDGGNLSLQVHPTTQYIQETFNMRYTQDESYYILDSGENSCVYLGAKEGIEPEEFIATLNRAQKTKENVINRF